MDERRSRVDLVRLLNALNERHSAALRRAKEADEAARSLAAGIRKAADQLEAGCLAAGAELLLDPSRARRVSDGIVAARAVAAQTGAEIARVVDMDQDM